MAEVKGIGGVFIYSQDAERLVRWYEAILGVEMESMPEESAWFTVFFTRDFQTSVVRENPVFAIRQADEELPEERGFVLNLRVDDMDAFLEQIREKGVAVDEKILVWERGKHTWIKDLDGNQIELYEELFPA
jgi:catechol 2,3-dioxygenase-like lactoylglutathione lyase family enzyme